jgi:vancomycin resistance protein VanJ
LKHEPSAIDTYASRILRWLARGVVAGALLGALFVVVGERIGPERFWLLAFVEYLPYPVHLAPALLALVLSLALGRWWRGLALLTVVLVAWPVMGLELHDAEPAGGRMALRVMTYNIKAQQAATRPDGYVALAREVEVQNPDILLVQDADDPVPPGAPATLLDSLFGTRLRYVYGQFGIASRYPLRECGPGLAPSRPPGESWIHCIAEIGGTAVDVYAVHLRTPREGLNAPRRERLAGRDDWQQNVAERMAQAAALARVVRAGTRPVILGGDLNAPEISLVVRTLLRAGLRDAWSVAGFGYGYTYGHALRTGFSFLRIDHVLASPQIGVADSRVGGWRASDHRPVIADLWLPRANARSTSSAPASPRLMQ